MNLWFLSLTACSYGVPGELMRIERAAVEVYDLALAGDIAAARAAAAVVAANWSTYQDGVAANDYRYVPSNRVLAAVDAAVDTLAEADGHDPIAMARAANEIGSWTDELQLYYHGGSGRFVVLEHLEREVILDALEGDFAAVGALLPPLEDGAASLSEGFYAEEAPELVDAFWSSLEDLQAAIDAVDAEAAEAAAESGLDVLGELPGVWRAAQVDTTVCIMGCS